MLLGGPRRFFGIAFAFTETAREKTQREGSDLAPGQDGTERSLAGPRRNRNQGG
jgi:hypothetical protein